MAKQKKNTKKATKVAKTDTKAESTTVDKPSKTSSVSFGSNRW